MTPAHNTANPFALMMYPEAVIAAVAGSERLARLKSRICRPLDKVAPVSGDEGNANVELELCGAGDAPA